MGDQGYFVRAGGKSEGTVLYGTQFEDGSGGDLREPDWSGMSEDVTFEIAGR